MKRILNLRAARMVLQVLLYVGILLLFYHGIGDVYFQQDEWHKIGKAIYFTHVDFFDIFKQKFGFHFIPLATLYYVIGYILFGLNAQAYLIAGLFLHAIASVLVYEISRRLFGKKNLAFGLSVFFLIHPGIHQVILNEMVSLYSAAFILVAGILIILFDGMKEKSFPIPRLITALLMGSAAFFMLEVWIAIFLLAPVFVFLWKKPKKMQFQSGHLRVFALTFVVLVGIFLFGVRLSSASPIPNQAPMRLSLAYNAATVPVKFLVEYGFGLKNIYALASYYQRNISYWRSDPFINQDLMAITGGYETVLYYVFAIFAAVAAFIINLSRRDEDTNRHLKILLFGLLWTAALGAAISPQGRYFLALESRYLYLGAFGVLLILGAIYSMLVRISEKNRVTKRLFTTATILYILFWGIYSYRSIRIEVNQVIRISRIRQQIITQILRQAPILPKRTIVYMYCTDGCTDNSKLGQLPEWIVPFQNGFGWTLLTLYAHRSPGDYGKFFHDLYFWERGNVGYREFGDTGFGYVTTKKDLDKIKETYQISDTDIIQFEYHSGSNTVRRVSFTR